MNEVAAELAQWLESGEPIAIATVVRISGSAPRPLGATLIARAGERIAGSVSNGCVEAAVYEEAMGVLRDGRARTVSYGISDEFAFSVGLSCGGAIDVLIEPVGALHRAALEAARVERPAVLARIVAPADRAGTVALLREDRAEGWSPELAALKVDALAALADGRARTAAVTLADGRAATVYLEALATPPLLAILAEVVAVRHHGDQPVGEPMYARVAKPAEAIDPICGMTVAITPTALAADYDGTTYYFCAAGCRRRFLADPVAALATAG